MHVPYLCYTVGNIILCVTSCLCVFDLGPLWVDRYENPYQVGFAIHPEQVDLKTMGRHQSFPCR